MGRRLLLRVTAVCNVLVLGLGVAVVGADLAPQTDVAFGRQAQPGAVPPPSFGVETQLPAVGDAERPPADPDGHRVDLPAHELDYLPPVVRTGVLEGDPDVDGGCAWIEIEGVPHAIRWPGYQASFVPAGNGDETLELVDDTGGLVARGGATVWFTGARSGGAERLERCHVGAEHVWYVGEISTVAPPGH